MRMTTRQLADALTAAGSQERSVTDLQILLMHHYDTARADDLEPAYLDAISAVHDTAPDLGAETSRNLVLLLADTFRECARLEDQQRIRANARPASAVSQGFASETERRAEDW